MNKKERKSYLVMAQKFFNETKGDINDALPLMGDDLTPDEWKILYVLIDKGILTEGNPHVYFITPYIESFIKNGGYTEDELKEKKDNLRKDITLYIAGLAILISIGSLIVSIFALKK